MARYILHGCNVAPLESGACQEAVAWSLGNGKPRDLPDAYRWLLAHCDDGIVWGRHEGGSWQLSSRAFPELIAAIKPGGRNVQQLRLFGPGEELLLWRDDADFRGRRLIEVDDGELPEWLRPEEEEHLLVGRTNKRVNDGFTHFLDASGRYQVLPVATEREGWPLRLVLRHYFESDNQTGSVRVAASRLVTVKGGQQS